METGARSPGASGMLREERVDSSLILVSMDTKASIPHPHPEVWGMREEAFLLHLFTPQLQDGGQSCPQEGVHTQSTARDVGECNLSTQGDFVAHCSKQRHFCWDETGGGWEPEIPTAEMNQVEI